jgi:hypothetical protein
MKHVMMTLTDTGVPRSNSDSTETEVSLYGFANRHMVDLEYKVFELGYKPIKYGTSILATSCLSFIDYLL